MEENTVRVNEIEEYEIEPNTTVEEAPESSNGGALVAGIVGGFLAYAFIGGAKKLAAIVQDKLAERKQKEAAKNVVEAEFTETPAEQQDSEDEPEDK
jgi:NAD/NADP transhydrogenase alpha subunit